MQKYFGSFLKAGLFVTLLVLMGCASGSKFTPMAKVPDGKALIYIYRRLNVSAIASKHIIFANGEPVTALANASYYPFLTSPGMVRFSSRSLTISPLMNMVNSGDDLLTIPVESGHTYYVEFHIGDTFGPKMILVDAEKGTKRLQKCRMAGPFTEQAPTNAVPKN